LKEGYEPVDLSRLRRYALKSRKSVVDVGQFAKMVEPDSTIEEFLSSLPSVLAADVLKRLARAMADAAKSRKTILIMSGAHLLKCGLTPILLDLAERGVVSAFATHGATLVHDIEVALIGRTSEDVASAIRDGSFGMSEETAKVFARICEAGVEKGLGRAAGEVLSETPKKEYSLFAGLRRLGVTVTVHSAVGTDIVHMHPELDPAALGEATHIDFRKLCSVVESLEDGVLLNIGSAVIMPEVFIKALSVARNLSSRPNRFVAANLDFIKHYRTSKNILERPGGVSIELVGHHEIILPLLRVAVLVALSGRL